MNRLARERSPYLLQHASNPVDWYPWGSEAFEKARAEDKPIFLSVGYSTCHWCHVMEHESFESAAIAGVLNEHFVSIKVDREERPDVDRVYMTFVQGTTGSGGWPMSVWLTPSLKPFFGGTYFPPDARWGRPGFVDILRQIAHVWVSEREKLERSADSVTEQLRGAMQVSVAADVPDRDALRRIVQEFRTTFDATHGGFGGAPKFPRPSELLFLLREHARTGDPDALAMVLATLRSISLGGMRDHLGGGFHRYSVDAAWRVPHFEKMLYDQAQLVLALVEAAQASGDAFYIDVAEDTLHYVMREMTDAEGGFFSAEDADSVPPEQAGLELTHRAEGAFYLWTAAEIDTLFNVVGSDTVSDPKLGRGGGGDLVKARFGIEANGNAPTDPQEEFVGKNLLYAAKSLKDLAEDFGTNEAAVRGALAAARQTMFAARASRPRPHLDDKVLTAWNGLMIGAFARVARVIGALGTDGRATAAPYLTAAQRAAGFIQTRMWNGSTGTLLRVFRGGDAGIDAFAEDYAYLIFGLLELFQADGDPHWLEWAVALQHRQDELFWDDEHGGWYSTTGRDNSVLVRMKEDYDGAEPTASAVAVTNLLWLSHLASDEAWRVKIDRTLRLFGERLSQLGRAVPMMAAALSTYHAGVQQIVLAAGTDLDALARSVAVRYRPFALVLQLDDDRRRGLAERAPWLAAMTAVDGRAAAYVCRDFTCERPVTTPDALEAVINHTRSERTPAP